MHGAMVETGYAKTDINDSLPLYILNLNIYMFMLNISFSSVAISANKGQGPESA